MYAASVLALSAFLVFLTPWQEANANAMLVAVNDSASTEYRSYAQQVPVVSKPGDAVGLTVEDVDASLALNPQSLVNLSKGASSMMDVMLGSEPTAIKTASASVSDASELSVFRMTLEFTPVNWDEAQKAVLSGLAGYQVDGSQAVAFTHDLGSSDTVNDELPVLTKLQDVTDLDLALDPTSLTDPTSPTDLGEGESSVVGVMLATAPAAIVNVAVSVSDATEMSVSTASLVFTTSNWNVAQTVVLSAIDDGIVENMEDIVVTYQLSSTDTVYDDKSITRSISIADKVVTPSITLETASLDSIQEGDNVRAVTLSLSHPADAPVSVDIWLEDNYAEVTLVGSVQSITVTRSFGAIGRKETLPIQETTFTVQLSFQDDELWSGDQRSFRLGAAIKGGPGAYAAVAAVPLGNEDVAYSSTLDFLTGYAFVSGTVFDDEDIIETSPEEINLRRDTTVTIDWSVPVRRLPAVALRDGTSTQAETNAIRAGYSIEVTATANRVSIHRTGVINPIREGGVMKAGNIDNLNTLLEDIPEFVLSARELPLYPEPVDVLLMVALRGEPRLESLPPEQRLVTVSGWVSEPELQFVPKTFSSIVEGNNVDVSFHLGEPPSGPVTVDVVADGIGVDNPEIVFSTSNWNIPRAVRFSTSNDVVVEDDETIEITYSVRSSDTDYDGKSPTQSLGVNDDDVADLLVDLQAFPDINEDGGTAMVTLRLMTAAKNGVTLSFTSSNPAVATLTATSVTARLTTLADRATVTLATVDDTISGNGPRSYSLNVSVVSGPGGYEGLTLSIPGMVIDDDDAFLAPNPSSPTVLAEGVSSMARVMLGTRPTATVNVAVSSSDASDLSVSTASLVFTPGDWSVPQPVALSAIDDGIVENTKEVFVTYQFTSDDIAFDGKTITLPFSITDKVVTPHITLETASLASIQESDSIRAVTLSLSHPADSPVTVDFWLEDNYAEVILVGSEQNITVTRSFGALGRKVTIPSQETTFTVHLSIPDDEFWSDVQRSFRLGAAIKGGPGAYDTVAAVPRGNEDVAYSSTLDLLTGYAFVTGTVFDDEDIIEASPEEIILRRGTAVTIDWSVPVRKLPAVALRDGTSTLAETNAIRAGFSIEVTATTNKVSIHLDITAGINPLRDGDVKKAGTIDNQNFFLDEIPQFVISAQELPLYPEPVDVLLMVALRGEARLENLPPELRQVTVSGWVTDPELQLVPGTLPSVVEGGNADVSFHLGEPPSASVSVDVVAEGVGVDIPEIVFSTSNWNTPRAVRFATSIDGVVEDDETIEITYNIRSSDTDYDGKSPTQSLVVTDKDIAGLLADPQKLPVIPENVGTATVTLRLMTAAESGVTLSFTSSNPAVATLTATSVTAMLTTLADRATVTLGAVDDEVATVNQIYSLNVSVISGPGGYDGLTLSIPGMVVDDDEPGLDLDPSSLSDLAEGESSTVVMMLGSEPAAVVTVSVSVSDASELSVSSVSLEFTPANWYLAQEVMLSGKLDTVVDGAQSVTVTYGLSSSDPVYGGLQDVVQSLEVTDVDVAGLLLDPTILSDLPEGTTSTVMVRLATAPTATVTVDVTSSVTGEVSMSPAQLEFTAANWNTDQTVTLTGVVDSLVDGTQAVAVIYDLSSKDARYSALSNVSQPLNVTDSDAAGLLPDPVTLAPINEEGGMATVILRLMTAAEGGVTLSFTSSDLAVATLAATSVTATLTTLEDRATVTIDAIEDTATNVDRPYALQVSVVSGPGGYVGLTLSVPGLVEDALPNLVLDPPSLSDVTEGGVTVVMVRLATQPSANVTVVVESSDESELTVSVAELVFTTANWDTPRPVTLSGVADMMVDGPKPVTVTYDLSSGDTVYDNLLDVTQTLDVTDSDEAGFMVTPASLPNINEVGGTATVTVRLATAAESRVTAVFTSPDPSATLFTANSITATLFAGTLETATDATVTLGAVSDDDATGNQRYSLKLSVSSGPGGYAGLTESVTGMVVDDDVPNLIMDPSSFEGTYNEDSQASQAINLATEPTADVTVSLSFDGLNVQSGSVLTFTSANWQIPQEVRFFPPRNLIVDDAPRDAVITYEVSSSDGGYNALGPFTQTISVSNTDRPNYAFDGSGLPRVPEGASLTVSLIFKTGAESAVTLGIWSGDTNIMTLSAATVSLTVQAAGDARLVTLFAVDNDLVHRSDAIGESFALTVSVVGGPPKFVSSAPKLIGGFVLDDDAASLELNPPTITSLAEGASLTVTVMLGSESTEIVNVAIGVSDSSLLSVSHTNLAFTDANWNSGQPVTLAGVTDGVVDGSKPVTLTYDLSSGDALYNDLSNVTQELEVTDAQVAGFVGLPASLPTIDENGGFVEVTLRLSTAAESSVILAITSPISAVAMLSPATVSATLIATVDSVEITLLAVNDNSHTGPREYALQVSVVSGPGGYDGLSLSVSGTVLDDDEPSLIMTPPTIDGTFSEGVTVTQSTSLATRPASNVTVSVTSDDPGVMEVTGSPLTFTRTNWAMPQEVVFSAVRNHIFDTAPREATITYELSSSDDGYSALGPFMHAVVVNNIDTAAGAFGFVGASTEIDLPNLPEGGTITVTVELRTGTEIPVSLRVWSQDTLRVTLPATTLTFTFQAPGDTGLVTVFGVDNDIYQAIQVSPGVIFEPPYVLVVDAISGPEQYVSQPSLFQDGSFSDDDVVSLELAPVTLANLAGGASSEVSVMLGSEPYGNVNVAVSVSDSSVLSVSHTNLVFTPSDWNVAQSVTLTGIADGVVGDPKRASLIYDTSSEDDPFYDAVLDVTQELDVSDPDIAGLLASPALLPTINEEGGTATVTVRLRSEAEADVILSFTSPFPAVATLMATPLRATLRTLADRATVTLETVADSKSNGNRDYGLNVSIVSGPGGYPGLTLSVAGMVVDDDTAGYSMTPTNFDGANIEEDQVVSQTTRLLSEPIANVTVSVSSDDATIIAGSQLTFSVANYQVPQEVRFMVPRNQVVEIPPREVTITYSASSSTGGYASTPDFNLTLDVLDLDEGGFVADTTTLPDIGEDGGTATVILRLTAAAEGGVALSLTSPFPAVATLTSTPLLATLTTLGDRATVTLEAVNDNIDRADRGYALQVSVVSGPGSYVGLTLSLAGIVNDDDTASLVLEPTTLPVLAEDATSTVSLSLATQPTATVTVSVASDVTTEATVTPAEIVFTADDWNTARLVTLSGVADNLVDGPKPVTITYDVSSSDDTVYKNLPGVTQSLEVTDVDVAGLATDPTTLPPINESGGTATVIVSLAAAAETGVEMSFTSSATAVATLLTATSVTATLTTTGDSATVTLGAVDDNAVTGNRGYALKVSVVSGPGGYAGLELTVTGMVLDDDTANLVLDPPSLPDLAEGATSTVSVKIATRPSSVVTVSVSSSDTGLLTVSSSRLVFTDANWNVEQPVTLSGETDNVVDGNQTVLVTYGLSSSDPVYAALATVTQSLEVTDAEVAGLLLDPTLPDLDENGGTAVVTVRLMTAAETGVKLSFTSRFGSATLTAASVTATLTTTADEATVTLGAVDNDFDTIGNRIYGLRVSVVSGPGAYDGLTEIATGIVIDDDQADLVLAPTSLPNLVEGATSTVMVKLATRTGIPVTVAVTVSDDTELSFSPATLVFTDADWNVPKPVTLSGVADSLLDGSKQVTVTYGLSSSDFAYLATPDVTQSLDVTDADVAGLESDPTQLPTINEAGDGSTATVIVRLSVAVETGVVLSLTSPFPAATLTATPLLATLTTAADGATVTLGAVDDNAVTGNRGYALKVSVVSGPFGYAGLELTVTGTVLDDDTANLVLDPASLTDLAEGATSTVSVMLSTQPTANVSVAISVSDETELSVSSVSLEFTPGNWNQAQEVVVSGLADNVVDGNQTVTVTYDLSSSDDTVYKTLPDVTQMLDVTDADVAGLVLDPSTSTLADLPEGSVTVVLVNLATQPASAVTVSISSSDTAVLSVSSVSLEFTPGNWNQAQEVVVSGLADNVVDGNQTVTVTYGLSSGDAVYGGLSDVTQTLTVTDVQVAGFRVTPGSLTLASINEAGDGSTATVTVRLSTAAEGGVALSFTSSAPEVATLTATSVTVTLTTADDSAIVTLGAVSDNAVTGNRGYALKVSVVSGPGGYAGLELTVTGTVLDDDSPNLVLEPPYLTDLAEGATSTVMVKLATQPASSVIVAVTSSNTGELSVSPAQLVFLPGNWNVARPVTLSGVRDNLVDEPKPVAITYNLSSSDAGYGGLPNVTQTLNVTDADVAGIKLTPDSLPEINEGVAATVIVSLLAAAETGVELSFTSSATAVATLSPATILATLTTTGDSATVTLETVDDDVDGIDRIYALKVSVVSGPGAYAGLELTVTGTVLDNDVADLVLTPTTLSVLAEGAASTVSVRLGSQPTANVSVAIASSDRGELLVSPAQLVFLPGNWNINQPVTLSGVRDNEVDGTQAVAVTYTASSSDNKYNSVAATTQSQDVTDLDIGGLALVPASLPPLSEPDGVATVSLRLTKSSSSPVTLAVWSSDTSVATLTSTTLTLTLMSELDRGAVALGVVDNTASSDRGYDLRVSVVRGVGGYAGVMLTAPGMVIDDDTVGVRFVPAALPRIDERGSLTVSVALGTTPTAPVTLEVSSRNRLVATLSSATVTLTLDGSLPSAPVTVSGVSNNLLADQPYELTVSVVGSGLDYRGQVASASGIVVSDDAVLVAEPADLGVIPREDGSVTVTLRLDSTPAMEVTVNIGSANPSGATLLGTSQTQTFTMDDLADRVTVTLVAVNDEGVYPRMFGLLVTVLTGNAPDAGFNSVLTLLGTVTQPGSIGGDTTTMLQLAVSDLASAGLAIDLVAGNVKRGASDGPRTQIGGHSLAGLTEETGVHPSQPPDSWSDSDPWSEPGDGEWKDVMRLVPGSGFVLPLSSGARAGYSTELWGGARHADLSGEPAIDGVRHSYDGDALAVQVGLTRHYASGFIAGFSIGNSWVDLEVSTGDGDEKVKAKRWLASIHPYVSLAPSPDTRLLLVAGYGDGTFTIVGKGDRKASMSMAAARLEQDWQLGGIDLSGKLHYLSVQSELDGTSLAKELSSKSAQSRVELEFSKLFEPGSGMSVRPYGSLGYLHESGTVDAEGSVELGAGLQGSWDAGLDADISARYQLDGAKRIEHHLEGRLSFDTGMDGRGLLLDASQEHSLSEEADGSASLANEYKLRLGHGWGRTLLRRHGVLGSYVSTVEGSDGGSFHGPRLGVSFEAASLELVAEQGVGEGRIHLNYVSSF